MPEVIKNVACPYCGACCDDLEVTVEDGKILEVKNACIIGTEIYHHASREGRVGSPRMRQQQEPFLTTAHPSAMDLRSLLSLIRDTRPVPLVRSKTVRM